MDSRVFPSAQVGHVLRVFSKPSRVHSVWWCRFSVVCVALVTAFIPSIPAGAVVNGVDVPLDDRRFDAVGMFLTAGSSSTGCAGGISGSCTLIGPNTVLIARHSLDIRAGQPLPDPQKTFYRVRFRRDVAGNAQDSFSVNGNACHGVYQEILVDQLYDAANTISSDQVIAVLKSEPVGITPIAVEIDHPPIRNTKIILAGWGFAGQCLASGSAWGLRYAQGDLPDQGVLNDLLFFSGCSITTSGTCLVCAPGGTWVTGNLHDSGAPILMEVASALGAQSELRLIGTVSTPSAARRPSSWNTAGGFPKLVQGLLRLAKPASPTTTIVDLFEFLRFYFAGDLVADMNNDGKLTLKDVLTFLNSFFSK